MLTVLWVMGQVMLFPCNNLFSSNLFTVIKLRGSHWELEFCFLVTLEGRFTFTGNRKRRLLEWYLFHKVCWNVHSYITHLIHPPILQKKEKWRGEKYIFSIFLSCVYWIEVSGKKQLPSYICPTNTQILKNCMGQGDAVLPFYLALNSSQSFALFVTGNQIILLAYKSMSALESEAIAVCTDFSH